MRRWLASLLLAPACLLAQFQIVLVSGDTERPTGAVVDLGAIDAGDLLDARFRLRNPQAAGAVLDSVAVAGAGFSIPVPPPLPVTIAARGALDFVVRFEPRAPGAFSAVLTVNRTSLILRAVATAGLMLWLEEGGQRVKLAAESTVDFGSVEVGAATTRRFSIQNPAQTRLALTELTVTGEGFRGPDVPRLPVELEPGASQVFEVVFSPLRVGAAGGLLKLNGRSFRLSGQGLNPALPKPEILLDPPAPRSGQQVKVRVRLARPAASAATGELSIGFEPATPGVPDDAAIGFLAPAGRVVSFSVERGAEEALFAGRSETVMQTGTTAGRLVLTARLGSHVEQATIVLAAQPPVVDAVRVVRSRTALELNLVGFDNTRSISELNFTFFDRDGRVLEPGAIKVEASSEFSRYFAGSTLGGVFALRVIFPVSGDVNVVSAVDIELTNAAGRTRINRVSF